MKKCSRLESSRKWRRENPERAREHSRKYREKNLDKERERSRKAQEKYRDKVRERKYGLTTIEYNNILSAQKNECAICSVSFVKEKPNIDHCHKTGRVRGLLCYNCNLGLGKFKDDSKKQ